MKRLLVIAGVVFALLLAGGLALPFVIDPNRFRPMLESQLTEALGRDVKVGDLKLSILGGTVRASDLSISDDPAYSKAPFVKAKSLGVGVEIWPFIASRKLHVTGLSIENPEIVLLQSPSGEWNFSSLGGRTVKQPAPVAPSPAQTKANLDLSVKSVRITGGRFTVGNTGAHTRPLTLEDVDIEVKDFSAASEFPFTLTANVAGGGKVKLDGTAGPINLADTAASPTSANWKIDALDLAGSGLNQNAPALAGVISFEGAGQSDGHVAHLKGKLKAERLKLAKGGTPSRKPVEFDFALDHDLRRRTGQLRQGGIHIGSAPASLTGTYAAAAETPSLHMTLDAPKMAVAELSEMLPAMAIVLPRGASLQGGTASAKVSMEGPVDRLVTSGTVSLDNTKIAGFDLGRKMAFIQSLAGIKANTDTEIQTLGAAVHTGPEGAKVENLQLIVPAIGNLDGVGTVSAANDLAFQMHAMVRGVSVPFLVQGTASDPAFRPDVKGIAKQELNQVLKDKEGVKGLIRGLLGGKK